MINLVELKKCLAEVQRRLTMLALGTKLTITDVLFRSGATSRFFTPIGRKNRLDRSRIDPRGGCSMGRW